MEQSKIWNCRCERENKKDDQSMTVTRTYAKLPFHDLSPERFEDICLQIAYRMRSWTDLHHYGVQGQDGAIDIFEEQLLQGGSQTIRKGALRDPPQAKPYLRSGLTFGH